ncbi:MAG: helicase-related protein, partial [Desulfosarcinaceae bacterium]
LTFLLNRGQGGLLAYSHHGSLAREIRSEVEQNLKAGLLKAIVATGSLELGIDIGALDEVILAQSPASVAEAVQRVGRAGHRVGETSRGTFYPSHAMDIVTSAVLVEAVTRGSIEAAAPMAAPLDVLAQVIVSMCAFETWHPDALYNFVRTMQPYHDLSRRQFDLVLNLLEGRYEQARLRELQPRITYDRVDQTLSTRKGALLALYTSGGVIPDRGYFSLRHAQSGARIGELDEEFVWEARIGQVFTLGTQNWRIEKITHNDVLVVPASRGKPAPPFWKAENSGRGFHLSEKIGLFLEQAEADLDGSGFEERMRRTHHLDDQALARLKTFLVRQRAHTGCPLPHRHHLVIEYTTLGPGGPTGRQVVWHTLWGGRVNRPLAVALEAAWEEAFGAAPQIYASNDSLSFILPREVDAGEMVGLVRAERVEELINKRLATTGLFGARFRECAGRALLLPRQSANRRMPLWLSRLRAQKLLTAVGTRKDFPILVETWRTCLQDEFDLPALRGLLGELEQGGIAWRAVQTAFPSPLARTSAWLPINTAMYQTDQGAPARTGGLTDELLFEITLDPDLRPKIDPRLAAAFASKRQRLAPGYSPDSPEELLDWVKERVALSRAEWQALLSAMVRDHGPEAREFEETLSAKLVHLEPVLTEHGEDKGAGGGLILAREVLPRWLAAFHDVLPPGIARTLSGEGIDLAGLVSKTDPEGDRPSPAAEVLAEWLRFHIPRPISAVARDLGIPPARLQPILDELADDQIVVAGALLQQGDAHEVCDRENFEILLRMARRAAVPEFEALEAGKLPLFLAYFQGLTRPGRTMDDLADRLDQLLALPAPAGLWETDLLPARLAGYRPRWMDQLIQEGELRWLGASGRKALFCYENELDLVQPEAPAPGPDEELPEIAGGQPDAGLFVDPMGRYPFAVLQQNSGLNDTELNDRLWSLVWQGKVGNDAYAALRRGVETRFKLPGAGDRPAGEFLHSRRARRPGRFAFRRGRAARPVLGNWYRLPWPDLSDSLVDREERNKARARLLLDRYGVVFREILAHELPMLQWKSVFRALRLMELAGEVHTGYFFKGIQGLQFISPRALHLLRQDLPGDAIYWLNAVDPASVCGLGLEALQPGLPKRLPGCHLVYHGAALVLVSRQQARRLYFHVPAGNEHLLDYLAFLAHLLTRPVLPLRSLRIETINNLPAVGQAAYLDVFSQLFDTAVDPKGVNLYRRHH